MKFLNLNKFLVIILLLATFLRFYNLSANRPSLTNDEAALGYNAYSILKTGHDEHGEYLPIVFKSFGDWKPGLYIYATIPSVALFGLTEFSVRLPSALFGVIGVFLIYLLSKYLFRSEKIGLLSAFFLAISPWHLNFSRGAWEANLALTLLLAGTVLFLYSLRRPSLIFLSAIFFGLTFWTYQSAKVASVIVLISLTICYLKELKEFSRKYLSWSFLIGSLLIIPIVLSLFSGKGGRLEVMSVFSYRRSEPYIESTILNQDNITEDSFVFKLFHSEEFNFVRGIAGRYFNHFSGRYLFIDGDWQNQKHSSPNIGYLLLLDMFFFVSGFYALFKNKKREYLFVLAWLLLAPFASALSRDSIHGVRSLNMVAPLSITLALGADVLFSLSKKLRYYLGYLVVFIFGCLYLFNFFIYLDAYYIHGPVEYARYLMYGYKDVVREVIPIRKNYEKILFSQSYDQPYIYFLFYGVDSSDEIYQPQKFVENRSFLPNGYGDVGLVEDFANIEFRSINWPTDKNNDGWLIVGRESDFPLEEIDVSPDYKVKRFYYPDGSVSFIMVEVHKKNAENN